MSEKIDDGGKLQSATARALVSRDTGPGDNDERIIIQAIIPATSEDVEDFERLCALVVRQLRRQVEKADALLAARKE